MHEWIFKEITTGKHIHIYGNYVSESSRIITIWNTKKGTKTPLLKRAYKLLSIKDSY